MPGVFRCHQKFLKGDIVESAKYSYTLLLKGMAAQFEINMD